MKPKTSLILFWALFFWFLIFQPDRGVAQETKVYTLQESIAEALANNWSLRAKQEKLDQATSVKNQARADFLPKLSTTYGYTRLGADRKIRYLQDLTIGTRDNYWWQGTVTQPLFTGFALLSTYRLAQLGIDQSKMEIELEKLDLALNVKQTYFEILAADKALEAFEKAEEALASHVKVARSFYEVGMIPINDLLESEVELGNAQHDVIRALNATQLSRSTFNTVLSRPVNAKVEVEDILVHEPEGGSFQEYLQKALKGRPEMRLIEINILQGDQRIRLARSKNYPEVVLTFDYMKEGDTLDVSGSDVHEADEWQAGAALSWTFWEWGKTYYAVKEQESLKKELIKTRMALEDQIQLQIKDGVLGLEEAEKNIPITQKAVEQGEENLRVSEERYKAQVSTSTEVLDAQRYLTTARVNNFNAYYNYHLAKARLLWAMGEF
ncbi:MAG: TolC family protein [Desulfatiglandaceae bacterium]